VERKAPPSRPPSARLFVALDLPGEARERLVAWQHDALGRHDELRLVTPEALHVTLAFLGHHPEEEVDAIAAAALSRVAGLPVPLLEPVRLVGVPPRLPRLFAADLADEGGRAAAVHDAVAEPLVEGGWYEREKRPFWPHLTVARVRARERPPRVDAEPPSGAFEAREVVLYRSRLSRSGAQYQPLARMRLA
jgi:2'-5' RNA ligase